MKKRILRAVSLLTVLGMVGSDALAYVDITSYSSMDPVVAADERPYDSATEEWIDHQTDLYNTVIGTFAADTALDTVTTYEPTPVEVPSLGYDPIYETYDTSAAYSYDAAAYDDPAYYYDAAGYIDSYYYDPAAYYDPAYYYDPSYMEGTSYQETVTVVDEAVVDARSMVPDAIEFFDLGDGTSRAVFSDGRIVELDSATGQLVRSYGIADDSAGIDEVFYDGDSLSFILIDRDGGYERRDILGTRYGHRDLTTMYAADMTGISWLEAEKVFKIDLMDGGWALYDPRSDAETERVSGDPQSAYEGPASTEPEMSVPVYSEPYDTLVDAEETSDPIERIAASRPDADVFESGGRIWAVEPDGQVFEFDPADDAYLNSYRIEERAGAADQAIYDRITRSFLLIDPDRGSRRLNVDGSVRSAVDLIADYPGAEVRYDADDRTFDVYHSEGGRTTVDVDGAVIRVVDAEEEWREFEEMYLNFSIDETLEENVVAGSESVDGPDAESASQFTFNYSDTWWSDTLQTENAWDLSRGAGITVAVIDTGVDFSHPDLAGQAWRNWGETPGDGIDNDGNGYVDDIYGWNFLAHDNSIRDDHGHGTHVAGIIGALDNGWGITGVAPDAKIMAVKALSAKGTGTLQSVISAIRYAADMGARVINMSLGWSIGRTLDQFEKYQKNIFDRFIKPVIDVIDYAIQKGAVVIVAAGNNNNNVNLQLPAAIEEVISVGATTPFETRASFSNFGYGLDLSAPGFDIYSLRAAGTSMGDTAGRYFTRASGTSMAAPMVAGAAALLLAQDPSLDWKGVQRRLALTAFDPSGQDYSVNFGDGRINVFRALTYDFHDNGGVKTLYLVTPDRWGMVRYEFDREGYLLASVTGDGDTVTYYQSGWISSWTYTDSGWTRFFDDNEWDQPFSEKVEPEDPDIGEVFAFTPEEIDDYAEYLRWVQERLRFLIHILRMMYDSLYRWKHSEHYKKVIETVDSPVLIIRWIVGGGGGRPIKIKPRPQPAPPRPPLPPVPPVPPAPPAPPVPPVDPPVVDPQEIPPVDLEDTFDPVVHEEVDSPSVDPMGEQALPTGMDPDHPSPDEGGLPGPGPSDPSASDDMASPSPDPYGPEGPSSSSPKCDPVLGECFEGPATDGSDTAWDPGTMPDSLAPAI